MVTEAADKPYVFLENKSLTVHVAYCQLMLDFTGKENSATSQWFNSIFF